MRPKWKRYLDCNVLRFVCSLVFSLNRLVWSKLVHLGCPLPAEGLWQSAELGDYIRSSSCSVLMEASTPSVGLLSVCMWTKRKKTWVFVWHFCLVSLYPTTTTYFHLPVIYFHFSILVLMDLNRWQGEEIIPCLLSEPRKEAVLFCFVFFGLMQFCWFTDLRPCFSKLFFLGG